MDDTARPSSLTNEHAFGVDDAPYLFSQSCSRPGSLQPSPNGSLLPSTEAPQSRAPVMYSRRASARFRCRPAGPPRLLDRSFPARCPQPPRKVHWLHLPVTSPMVVWLHLSRQAGHLRIPIEAESGSLALRLTGSPPDTPVPLLKPTLVRLHVEQTIYMVNSFQFTRSARLILVTDSEGVGC